MVNQSQTDRDAGVTDRRADPERDLAVTYAQGARRAGLGALLALDDALAAVLRTTSEPALGQMRLVWWRDALIALDDAPPPAMPVLEAIAADVVPHGVHGAALAEMTDGWLMLIEEERFGGDALERYAAARGAVLFGAAAEVLGAAGDPVDRAGRGWALVDLARHLRDGELARDAIAMASPLLDRAVAVRWSREGRALGALAHLARLDARLDPREPARTGSPRRVGRLVWHRLTGR